MKRQSIGILKKGAVLLVVSLPFLMPARARAETIEIVNNTKATLVVQCAAVVRGAVRRGTPTTLGPGEKMSVTALGNKLVNVYDARLPNRMLYQGTVPASTTDGSYSITQPDIRVPKLQMDVNRGSMTGKQR
jgi:hypothetical protein